MSKFLHRIMSVSVISSVIPCISLAIIIYVLSASLVEQGIRGNIVWLGLFFALFLLVNTIVIHIRDRKRYRMKQSNEGIPCVCQELKPLTCVEVDNPQRRDNHDENQLREYYTIKVLTTPMNEDDYTNHRDLIEASPYGDYLAVLVLQIDTLQNTRYIAQDGQLLLYAIHNMVSELLPKPAPFFPVVLDNKLVAMIAVSNTDSHEIRNELFRIATNIKNVIFEFLQLNISIGISQPYHSISHTMDAYSQSLQSLRCRRSLHHEIILQYDDMNQVQNRFYDDILPLLRVHEVQVISALRAGDCLQATDKLGSYMTLLVEHDIMGDEFLVFMIRLISECYNIVLEEDVSMAHVLSPQASVEYFIRLKSLEEIELWFIQDLFEPIANWLLGRQEMVSLSDIGRSMLDIIHQRYHEELTLDICGAELHFHPVHLSRVFKKEIGVGFMEYLVDYRMNIAKIKLEQTNIKISTLAEELNYSNTSSFIRVFRRIVGMTPGQYRIRER